MRLAKKDLISRTQKVRRKNVLMNTANYFFKKI